MKLVLLLLFFPILPFCGQNNPQKSKTFEGIIFFSMELLYDTLYYTYYVKDHMVRLDEFYQCRNCKVPNNYMLFNLQKKEIVAVSPIRKMYINLPVNEYKENPITDKDYTIIKTNNNKKILGYKCYQWRVRNKNQNTEISYWVAKDEFNFFINLLKLWNRNEKHAQYFLKIPDNNGVFPLLSEERTTLREEKMTLRVLVLQKRALDDNLFKIPSDYKRYDQ